MANSCCIERLCADANSDLLCSVLTINLDCDLTQLGDDKMVTLDYEVAEKHGESYMGGGSHYIIGTLTVRTDTCADIMCVNVCGSLHLGLSSAQILIG